MRDLQNRPLTKVLIATLFAMMFDSDLFAQGLTPKPQPTILIHSIQEFLMDWLVRKNDDRVRLAFHQKAFANKFIFSDTFGCLEQPIALGSKQTPAAVLMGFSRRLGGGQLSDLLSFRDSEPDDEETRRHLVNSPDRDGFHLYSYASLEKLEQHSDLDEDEKALRNYLNSAADLDSAYISTVAIRQPQARTTFLFTFLWIEVERGWKILHGALTCWHHDPP